MIQIYYYVRTRAPEHFQKWYGQVRIEARRAKEGVGF